jgi:hypothetical protein
MALYSRGMTDKAVEALRSFLRERLILVDEPGFADAVRPWNAAVTTRPAVIAQCRDTAEICAAVDAAQEAGLPLSVRSGAMDWGGRALRDGGLVIDLGGMRGVAVDPAGRTATVQGGALTTDLLEAAAPHGMVTATGVVRSIGLAGLTAAGGYGPLIGRYGLTLDNLLGAEVVLADGSTVTAGPDDDAELFWALRGGGCNFGVVTSLRYRLHHQPVMLAGMLMFPFAEARAVLSGYAEIAATAPDELTAMTGFLPGPDGSPLVFVCPFWSGDPATGEQYVGRFRALGHPIVDQIGVMPYQAAVGMFDANAVGGNNYLLRTRWMPDVSPIAVDALISGAAALTSPYSALVVNRFHGAAARVDPGATAFAQRVPHQVVEIIAIWPPGTAEDPHRAWADSVAARLDPVALPGGYPSLLGPDDDVRALQSYDGNLDRLLAAKHRYDPENIFASAVPSLISA